MNILGHFSPFKHSFIFSLKFLSIYFNAGLAKTISTLRVNSAPSKYFVFHFRGALQ